MLPELIDAFLLILSNGPIFISVLALIISIASYLDTQQAIRAAVVRENLARYLTAYSETISSNDALTDLEVFRKLPWREKERIKIVNGLLATVVDAMYTSDDPRAEIWAGYLRIFRAPVSDGFPVEAYVSHLKTRKVIDEIKTSVGVTQ